MKGEKSSEEFFRVTLLRQESVLSRQEQFILVHAPTFTQMMHMRCSAQLRIRRFGKMTLPVAMHSGVSTGV